MKKLITTALLSLICIIALAQAPQSFEYQAVVRDGSGNILISQAVGIQITLKQGSPSGTTTYQETFSTTTNLYGLVNLQIGTGTTGDDFSTINWANGPYFIEVALDATGGTSYSVMGTSQLLSVPYALHAKTVEVDNVDDADNDPTNEIELPATANVGDVLTWDGINWVASPKSGGKSYLILSGDITDSEAATKIANELGENTQFVYIQNTTNLTTVDLSGITELVELQILDNVNLTTVDLSGLKEVYSNNFITNNANLTTISLGSLTNSTNFIFADNSIIPSLNLSNLLTVKNGIQVERCPVLSNINFSALETTSNITINSTGVSNLVFTNLIVVGNINGASINIYYNSNLTNVSFPALTSIVYGFNANITIFFNPLLSNINLPVFNSKVFQCDFSNNALSTISHPNLKPQAQYGIFSNIMTSSAINSLLNDFVTIVPDLNGVAISLENQTPLAPPTGQGITDKNTLITNGNTVTTD